MAVNESIPFTISSGLQTEIEHLQNEQEIVYDSIEKLNEVTKNSLYATVASELLSRLHQKSKIVDLGCGFGETSLTLASAGHEIYSIEPALNRCHALSKSFKNLGLTGHVYACTAEDLNKIPVKNMDGALFYSSLHHCDYPLQALKNVKEILGPKGVIVICEPVLKFYWTKKRYNKQLLKNPVKMGHYGGNEHIYYFKEYQDMLTEAGFSRIEFQWTNIKIDPRKTLTRDLSSMINGSYQYSPLRCIVKYLVHSVIKKMCETKPLNRLFIKPLMKISLLQATFIGYVS